MNNWGYKPNKAALRKCENLRGVERELFTMATASFEWGGALPDGLPSWMLERYLYDVGTCAAFMDNGYLTILPAYGTSKQDMYYRFTKYLAVGLGYQKELDVDDIVLIYNDSSHRGSWETVREYAKVINEINSTDRANIKQLKIPFIFAADEEMSNSVKAAMNRVDNDEIFCVTTNRISAVLRDGFSSTQTGVKYLGDDLKKHRDDIYNECLTKLGFDNVPVTKKERLISDEAHGNDSQINFFRKDRLDNRLRACEEIKKKFGVNITVKWAGGENNESMDE